MTEKIIPDGYKLVAVKGLDELVYWLERCKDKGHIENCADLIEPFEAFEYRNVSEESVISAHEAKAAPAAPQGEPVYQLARATGPVTDAWIDVAKDVYDDAGFYPSDFKRRILSATTAIPPQEPVTLSNRQFDLICQAIYKADTITMDGDYMMDSDDCIAVVRVMQALFDIAALREKQGGV